ncbi:MAG: hypothetical protein U0U46_05625 [Saprospiraceae bacterium]
MKPNFKYVADEDLKVQEGFPLAYKLIADKRILIDSNYLPVLELAEKGDSMAWFEMQEAFAYGTQGVPKHYGLARKYTDLIMKLNQGRDEAVVEGFLNSAKLELDAGNLEAAKQDLVQAIKAMVDKLPLEKWDMKIFDILSAFLQVSEPESY